MVQEVHGTGEIPADFADPAYPDWVEAARWLERQRDLYRRQKLLLVRVRLMKEALGGHSALRPRVGGWRLLSPVCGRVRSGGAALSAWLHDSACPQP